MKRSSRWRRRLARVVLLILGLLALAGVSALVIRFAPPWLVSTKGLSGTARLDELSRVRVALVALVIVALAGALAVYLLRSSTRDRREETRERQLIERFMRAVDQLGHPALDVRLGGIYSLERLARESPENHGPIIEILAAYVRDHAPWPVRATDGHREARPRPATDVQAALTVLGRRVLAQDTDAPIGLAYTALAGAMLTGAHLERALLTAAHLEGADLFKAHLTAADLEAANLRGAGLLLANLNDTVLWSANLEGARLYGANLEGAALKGANLEGANLQGANLQGAVLLNARYDDATIWPDGLDGAAFGAVRRAWPQEPAPWMAEPEEAVQPSAGGWAPEALAASEQPQSEWAPPAPEWSPEAPQTQTGWPPSPAQGPPVAENGESFPTADELTPSPGADPPPPPEWPHAPGGESGTPEQ